MNILEKIEKKYLDLWKRAAAMVPESTREEILAMKKSGKSVREICFALGLATSQVSIIVIEEFAKERGETPVFTVGNTKAEKCA